MKAYVVQAQRNEDWWALSIDVPGRSVWTQCRRLDQAESVAREAVAMVTSAPPDGFDLDMRVELASDIQSIVEATLAASLAAQQTQATASEQSRRTVRDLRDRGYTVRDCASLIGLSPARVSQLLAG